MTHPSDERSRVGRGRALAVGLTGGMAAGKTMALRLFAELGATTLSADAVIHQLYEQSQAKTDLHARFGPAVFDSAGRVDRRALAAFVLGNPSDLRWLEKLTHPFVMGVIQELVDKSPEGTVVVCEIPLLFEAGFADCFDIVVTIEAPSSTREERTSGRLNQDAFAELDRRQLSGAVRAEAADVAYVNSGRLEELAAFVREAYQLALKVGWREEKFIGPEKGH